MSSTAASAPAATASSAAISVPALATPGLVGYIVQCMLFGALSVQCFLYYLAFPRDSGRIKLLVSLLYTIDLAQALLLIKDNFDIFARGFGSPDELHRVRAFWFSIPILTGIGSLIVQCYFCRRIYIVQKSRVLSTVIVAMALAQFCSAIAAGIVEFEAPNLNSFNSARTANAVWLVTSAVCDVLIAASLMYHLIVKKPSFRHVYSTLSKVSRAGIETGLLVAVVACFTALLFLVSNSTYYMAPAVIALKVYSNTCMAMLNSRMRIVGGRNDPGEDDIDSMQAESHVPGESFNVPLDGDTWHSADSRQVLTDAPKKKRSSRRYQSMHAENQGAIMPAKPAYFVS